jgi:hypothetical protein
VTSQRTAWIVRGCALLYLVLTFFDWQHFTVTIAVTIRYGFNEWHGVGVIACGLAVALVAWEAARLRGIHLPTASVSPAFVSFGLAVLLTLFTQITFFSRSEGRQWPAWIGTALSIVVGAAAVVRARADGVELFRLTPAPEARQADDRP